MKNIIHTQSNQSFRLGSLVIIVSAALLAVGGWLAVARDQPARATPVKVGMVVETTGITDMGWNWMSYQGLVRAEDELGVVGSVYTPTSEDDFEPLLLECIADGNDLCFGLGWRFRDLISDTAHQYTETYFAILDTEYEDYPDNLRALAFAEDETGYLAGTLAGLMSQSDVIGEIGGMTVPAVVRFMEGYQRGAECANPQVTVLVSYTNTFVDPGIGAIAAQEMISQSADVIFAPAGPTGDGAVLTATQSGVWGIGVDIDQYYTLFMSGTITGSEKLLSSAIKRLDNAVYDTIADYVAGNFTAGTELYNLANDGVGLAPYHEAEPYVPPLTHSAVERARKGIVDGIVKVDGPCISYVYLPMMRKP